MRLLVQDIYILHKQWSDFKSKIRILEKKLHFCYLFPSEPAIRRRNRFDIPIIYIYNCDKWEEKGCAVPALDFSLGIGALLLAPMDARFYIWPFANGKMNHGGIERKLQIFFKGFIQEKFILFANMRHISAV